MLKTKFTLTMKFTEEEKSVVLLHLKGLVLQDVAVNGRHVYSDPHHGAFGDLMKKFESTRLVLEFNERELTKLFRYLNGASIYENVVHKTTPLGSLIEKIARVLYPVPPNPRVSRVIKKKEDDAWHK